MCIYSIVNVENLELYEPSMLNKKAYEQVLPTIKDFTPKALAELSKDKVL
jgi:hypothetical protein